MKKLFSILALILVFCMPAYAMAATEPNTKTIEETTSYESDTIRITIDRWCYAFNRTSLRFFVANVYVNDPAQLHTNFALSSEGESVVLSNAAGRVMDRVDFDLLKADVAWSRTQDGSFTASLAPTPGRANQ